MNFTKQYIDLCKNPKLQGLRKEIQADDWIYADFSKTYHFVYMADIPNSQRDKVYWLPTGDQLDDEIVKICRKKFGRYFQYEMCFITTEWYGSISYWKESEEYMKDCQKLRYAIQIKENPLIAKLKLLLSLLESEDK